MSEVTYIHLVDEHDLKLHCKPGSVRFTRKYVKGTGIKGTKFKIPLAQVKYISE